MRPSAQRAREYSDGAQYVDYKAFLLHICSAVAAAPAPTPSDLTQRQKAARLLEGSRSRDVARLIATGIATHTQTKSVTQFTCVTSTKVQILGVSSREVTRVV